MLPYLCICVRMCLHANGDGKDLRLFSHCSTVSVYVCVCACGRACSLCVRLCAYNCLPLSLRQPQAVATIGGIASNQPASFDSLMSSTCQWLPLTLIPQHAQRLSGRKPTHTHTRTLEYTQTDISLWLSEQLRETALCSHDNFIHSIPFG